MEQPKPPANMTVVTKERFYELLNAEKRNITSSVLDSPEYVLWSVRGERNNPWGWSTPGWQNYYKVETVFAVANNG